MKTKRIQVSQIHMPVSHNTKEVLYKAAKVAGVPYDSVMSSRIVRRSIDARKKNQVHYTYRVELTIPANQRYARSRNISLSEEVRFDSVIHHTGSFTHPPVIAGMGPAGLFAGYLLALNGCSPILLERGKPVEERIMDVRHFWETGQLDPHSNVQFGEGGAGTFSDGKLNTGVKDRFGRNRFVLETFVRFGAPEDILYDAKPHIGTDILIRVIANMREEMKSLGAQILYESTLTDLVVQDSTLKGVVVNHDTELETDACILSVGHSARDTFHMLAGRNIPMEAKPFAVGLRIEHPQELLDARQYGEGHSDLLPRASYKLTGRTETGRSVYTFCMCPGGYVVNASSDAGQTVVNGMSDRAQDSPNANSAVVLSIPASEFQDATDPLAGIAFQEALEHKAWALGGGKIPQQLFGDFENNTVSVSYGAYSSCTKGETVFADLRKLFSEEMNRDLTEAVHLFGKKIKGFDRPDAILSGVESRTSSPVRILRDETCQSDLKGLFPCGEGAGYAGGITSAAMDGLRCAEALLKGR
ncbi:MAG: FAD-dependent oxidoreductase [Eubacterium sp.]|nr:FAD-dependent oxidoreductase [Eubacterium sp.]